MQEDGSPVDVGELLYRDSCDALTVKETFNGVLDECRCITAAERSGDFRVSGITSHNPDTEPTATHTPGDSPPSPTLMRPGIWHWKLMKALDRLLQQQ